MRGTLEERFWGKVTILGPDECWLWRGAHNGDGYGTIAEGVPSRKMLLAHRVSAQITGIDTSNTIDHLCHDERCTLGRLCPHRGCVNPGHLGPAERVENWRRGNQRKVVDRSVACKHGHVLAEVGLYSPPDGSTPECLACRRDQVARHRARR